MPRCTYSKVTICGDPRCRPAWANANYCSKVGPTCLLIFFHVLMCSLFVFTLCYSYFDYFYWMYTSRWNSLGALLLSIYFRQNSLDYIVSCEKSPRRTTSGELKPNWEVIPCRAPLHSPWQRESKESQWSWTPKRSLSQVTRPEEG